MKALKWLFFIVAIIVLLMVYGASLATERNSTSADASAVTGDQLVGGDSSAALGLGFAYALGDVDLNEGQNCYVSTAKGNIIFGRQKVELNPWCAALFYDANRKHAFAAVMRCSIETISGQYLSNEECVVDQTLSPEMTSSPIVEEVVAKFAEVEDEHEALVEDIQQQLEEQQAQYEELAARRSRARAPQPSAAELYWTDERRAKLEAIKDDEND